MLELRGITHIYNNLRALNNLNISVKKGEIFGFVGPNGAGKTTTIKIMCGLLKPTVGNVIFDGVDVLSDKKLLSNKIGYMPDFFGVYDNLKVKEYMDFYASTYQLSAVATKKRINELLDLVGLNDYHNRYVDELSRGMKQRLCLARSMVHNPEIIILDEPSAGLDPRARNDINGVLKSLGQLDKTVIISSHILSELSNLCTTIGIIQRGEIKVHGSVNEILEKTRTGNPVHIEVNDKIATAVQIIRENKLVEKLSISGNKIVVSLRGGNERLVELLYSLTSKDVPVIGFYREQGSLESLFLQLTKEGDEGIDEYLSNT